MLTYEQLTPVLHKWAARFQNNRFCYWELISEVWLRGHVQKLADIRFASDRVRWDMIDYMRLQSNMRVRRRAEAAGRHFPSEIRCSSLVFDEDSDIYNFIGATFDTNPADTKDFFDSLLRGFDRTCKLIIILRYQCDLDFREIATTIGVTPSRISQLHSQTVDRLRAKLTRINIEAN